MNTVDSIIQRIAVINAESKRLNEERNINIGKKETLTKQLNSAIEKYKNDYGVSLDVTTLDAEINRVVQSKESEVKAIEEMLSLIQAGRYADAEAIVSGQIPQSVEVVSEASVAPTVEPTPVAPAVEPTSVEPAPVAPTPVAPIAESVPTPSVATPPVVDPTPVVPTAPNLAMPEPVAPTVPVAEPTPIAPPPVNTSGIAALNGFSAPEQEAPVAPPTSALDINPSQIENVTSFQAILGGSSFQV